MPLIRAALAFNTANPERATVTIGSIDTLMTGCLLALIAESNAWRNLRPRIVNGRSVGALLVVGFVLVPYASAKIVGGIPGALVLALAPTVTAIAIAAMVAYVVAEPHSLVGRLLNLPVMCHIGIISYSIYLWQQLFTANPRQFGFTIYLLILAAAELSFWLIEKPIIRLRARLAIA